MLTALISVKTRKLRGFLRILRPLVRAVLYRYAIWKIRRKERIYHGMTLQQKFSHVYSQNVWGSRPAPERDFYSGPGSAPQYTASLVRAIDQLVERHGIRSIADIGCGDFRVGHMIVSSLRRQGVRYVGYDIVPELVARNAREFTSEGVEFRCLNVVEHSPSPADLILVREVFQHLSNSEIQSALRMLQNQFVFLVVSEAVYVGRSARPNLERLGDGVHSRVVLKSGVFLDEPPFNITAELLDEAVLGDDRRVRSLLIRAPDLDRALCSWAMRGR